MRDKSWFIVVAIVAWLVYATWPSDSKPEPKAIADPEPAIVVSPTTIEHQNEARTAVTQKPSLPLVRPNLEPPSVSAPPRAMPQKTKTDLFIERYEKADATDILRDSSPFTGFGAHNSGIVATRALLVIPTVQGEVKIFTSFDTEALQGGCVSIGGSETINGSLRDGSLKLIKVADENAFGVLIRNSHLLVYYANVETWGQLSSTEEPRIILYYRRDPTSKNWVYQGKGSDRDRVDMDYNPYKTHEDFCSEKAGR